MKSLAAAVVLCLAGFNLVQAQDAAAELAVLTRFELPQTSPANPAIHDLLDKYVAELSRMVEKNTASELQLRCFSARKNILELLATEGYFTPQINFISQSDGDGMKVQIQIDLGAQSKVRSVALDFSDTAVSATLQESIRSQWSLPAGAPFRDADWTSAKKKALDNLVEHSYATVKISQSEAGITPPFADLTVVFDSGPVFYIGDLQVQGLQRYQPWLLERYHPPQKGAVYQREQLLKFQRELQNSPYFSQVTVSVEPDPAQAQAVPVTVLINERKEYDFGLGAGYSSNTGARGEVSFRDRDFINDAYDLRSVIRIEQLRQIGYADVYLPPRLTGYQDSFGVLLDRTDIAGLITSTSSLGIKRVIPKEKNETRLGVSFVMEKSSVRDGETVLAKALVSSIGWSWRSVDSQFEPRKGAITQFDIGGAARALLSDQNFLRLYGKYQRWIPAGTRDVFILRAEAGYVMAPDSNGIPEDYLFRAGGTNSVRGYAYQSLGIRQNNGVVGGRMLATSTAEYVHWLNADWGVAGFIDVGDAANTLATLHANQGTGMGARYKTPAGPIALDLAYGRQSQQLRLDFSIGIAF